VQYFIGKDKWNIEESSPSGLFVVYKNNWPFETRCGDEFETESGACYAILNEYHSDFVELEGKKNDRR
jgi:hypothetical protein